MSLPSQLLSCNIGGIFHSLLRSLTNVIYCLALSALGQYWEVAKNMNLDSQRLGFKFELLILLIRDNSEMYRL